jgi:hypothetical protein
VEMANDNCSKYSCFFDLIQHTPLIHFQALQNGASLRATELKPKFDRFLKEKLSKELKKDDLEKLYLKGQKAFDYKVFIEPILSKPIDFEKYPPLFFGNMNTSYEKKKRKKQTDSLKIKFYSFKPEMIEYINKYFEAFLANTNFGTRQSKGFGSFYLDKDFDVSLVDAKKVYSFNVKERWDKDIELFYRFLRTGINEKGFYTKPLIFLYAKKQEWEWDKRAIKEWFFSDELEKQKQKYRNSDVLWFESDNKYLVRDLFGLSTFQYWKTYGIKVTKKSVRKNEKGKPYYGRMKSPIIFKVINDTVYFWVDNHFKRILGKDFLIFATGRPLKLSFPKNFDFDEMFKMIKDLNLSEIGKVKNKNKKLQDHEYFQKLNSILEDIKASL